MSPQTLISWEGEKTGPLSWEGLGMPCPELQAQSTQKFFWVGNQASPYLLPHFPLSFIFSSFLL